MSIDFTSTHDDHMNFRSGGIVTFRNGQVFYSLGVGIDKEGDCFVRIEDGVKYGYAKDGTYLPHIDRSGGTPRYVKRHGDPDKHPFDVISFKRCSDTDVKNMLIAGETITDFYGEPFRYHEAA